MKSSALHSILWALLILYPTVSSRGQAKPSKKEPASISGKVTIKGKGAAGITVGLRSADFGSLPTVRHKGTTDREGNYRITNVAPGNYQVMPAAPAFVISGEPEGRSLIVTEGEAVESVDFALTRGGVITGRVTDSEGRPLIEESIHIVFAETNNQMRPAYRGAVGVAQTDDRGIYRIFGIRQGKYIVAVGQSEDGLSQGPQRSQYKQTFYPAVTDAAKAMVIDVTEGSEATNVDITVGRILATFAVSGRIVNGETEQPLPNARFGLQISNDGNSHSFSSSGSVSNSRGEFKLENVTPGKYALFVQPQAGNELVAEAVPFEVIDHDVSGLVLKTSPGASVSGTIVLEGTNDKSALARLSQLQLHAYVRGGWGVSATINGDGSFRVGGLQSGFANFSLGSINNFPLTRFTIVRVERDGVAQLRGIEIKDGEQVNGVRVVVNYGNGTIRGIVRIENGELPPTARIGVWLTNLADDPTKPQGPLPSPRVDSRGRFVVEGLAAGTYEITATVYTPESRTRPPSTKQQVNVVDGVVTEVALTVTLGPTPGSGIP